MLLCAERTGKLPPHPPLSVSFIDRACGETFVHMLWQFSTYALRAAPEAHHWHACVRERTHTYCSLLCSMAVSKLRRIHGIAWVATMCAILAKLYEMRHSMVMELGASAQ